MKQIRRQSPEVLYCEDAVVCLDRRDVAGLVREACANPRGRVRVCAHRDAGDGLHEMLIVLGRDSYVRPHRHLGRSESSTSCPAARPFCSSTTAVGSLPPSTWESRHRGSTSTFGSTVPRITLCRFESEHLIFHETTAGPFDPSTTEQASWAPDGTDPADGRRFLRNAALPGREHAP